MKMKSAAVIAFFFVASSFASAQSYSYGFWDVGGTLYCNYEQLNVSGGHVWQGADNLSACGISHNAMIVGISAELSVEGNPAGFSLKGVAYADDIYDASEASYAGFQWFVLTGPPKCPIKHPSSYNWIGFASMSGVIFGDTYGQLSCDIPGRSGVKATGGLSIGNSQIPARK